MVKQGRHDPHNLALNYKTPELYSYFCKAEILSEIHHF